MIRILIKKPDWNYEEPNYFLNFEKLFKLFNTSSEQTDVTLLRVKNGQK